MTSWSRLAVLLVLATPASAQVPLEWTWHFSPVPESPSGFASKMVMSDLDGDGFDDVVAMQPKSTISGLPNAGRGWVLFGPTFTPTIAFQAAMPGFDEQLGSGGCVLGDANGDGELDLLVGSPSWMLETWDMVGRAHLFYGPDFQTSIVLNDPSPQQSAEFGSSVLLADVTGDGRDDIFVGAPFTEVHGMPANSGKVVFWDATDLSSPVTLVSPEPLANAWFGSSLDAAFMNGDAVPDILVGAENHFVCCLILQGRNFVFDGATLQPELTIQPTQLGTGRFGDIAFAGDLTGDGILDLLVTAYGTNNSSFMSCDGAVFLLTGPDFTTVAHVFLPTAADCDGGDNFGKETIVIDLDRDGMLDVAIWQPSLIGDESRVQVYFGPDWTAAQTLGDFTFTAQSFGSELAAGDLDGDGFDELLVGTPFSSFVGSIGLFDLQTLQSDVPSVSLGVGGDATWTADLGADRAGHLYLAALGLSGEWPGIIAGPGSYLPLNVDAMTSIGLSALGTPVLSGFLGVLDRDGHATFGLHFGAGSFPSLLGQDLTVAVITALPDGTLDAGSSGATIALEL